MKAAQAKERAIAAAKQQPQPQPQSSSPPPPPAPPAVAEIKSSKDLLATTSQQCVIEEEQAFERYRQQRLEIAKNKREAATKRTETALKELQSLPQPPSSPLQQQQQQQEQQQRCGVCTIEEEQAFERYRQQRLELTKNKREAAEKKR